MARGVPPETKNSVRSPVVVMRPTFPPQSERPNMSEHMPSVNHKAPSGPAVIAPAGHVVDAGKIVTSPVVVIRPMFMPNVNHNAPSGPAANPPTEPAVNSVITPAVVMRPIEPLATNQSA